MLDSYVNASHNFNTVKNVSGDYETRFLESLKLLHTPNWLNKDNHSDILDYENENNTKSTHTSLYSTKNRYDKLKQRFKPTTPKYEPQIRSKSESSPTAFYFETFFFYNFLKLINKR